MNIQRQTDWKNLKITTMQSYRLDRIMSLRQIFLKNHHTNANKQV